MQNIQPLQTALSIFGAFSGLTGLGGFLYSILSDRAKITVTDLSDEKGYYNAFFQNQFEDSASKLNRFAYVQISNDSKLPVCITRADLVYRNEKIHGSMRKPKHGCKFYWNGYKDGSTIFPVDEKQILLPMELQPFGYAEGFLVFYGFPDVKQDCNIDLELRIETNRKRVFSKKFTFLCENNLIKALTEQELRLERLGLTPKGLKV